MEIKKIQNFNTDIKSVPPSYQMKHLHMHNVYELIFIIDGICTVYLDRDFYRLESGSLIIIPALTPHRTIYLSGSSHNRVVFYFEENELEWFNKEFKEVTIDCPEDSFNTNNIKEIFNKLVLKIPKKRISYLTDIFGKIKYEKTGVDYISQSFIRTYFHEIMLFLLRCQIYKENVIQKTDVANEQIQHVIDYILTHYPEDITLSSTAKLFSLSESSLSKKFKAFTGHRFREYLIDIRVHTAADLLINTNLSISEIADRCGFSDSNSFGDTFKRIIGVSPSSYRKRC